MYTLECINNTNQFLIVKKCFLDSYGIRYGLKIKIFFYTLQIKICVCSKLYTFIFLYFTIFATKIACIF